MYTSSEYYDYDYDDRFIENMINNECIICWLPSTEISPVKRMKEHLFFVSNCDCNTFFHDTCLNKWLENKSSCPICCQKMSVKIIENDTVYMKIKKNAYIFFKILSTISIINFIYVSICNVINMYYFIFNDTDYN
jgi:hypothetical protein